MTFLEAALEILRHEGKPLHYKELTEHALGKKLLTFVGRTPEVTMQTQLTAAVKKAPGNPFVRVKPGIFGLLRYPEVTAAERAAYAKADAPAAANGSAKEAREGREGRDGRGDDRGGATETPEAVAGAGGAGADAAATSAARPQQGAAARWRPSERKSIAKKSRCTRGCRPRRAPRHWLKPAFSKAMSTRRPRMRRTERPWKTTRLAATDDAEEVDGDDEGEDEAPASAEGSAAGGEAAPAGGAGGEDCGPGGELGGRRRRAPPPSRRSGQRRGRRFRRRPASVHARIGMAARQPEAPRYGEPGANAEAGVTTEAGAPAGSGSGSGNGNVDEGQAGAPGGGDGQGTPYGSRRSRLWPGAR